MKSERRRIECLLFLMAFIAFAYFHQGGGWNANSRFAMVRAIVEQGKLSIDSYLLYAPASESGTDLRRIDLQNASYPADGKTNVLVWLDRHGKAFPIDPKFEGHTEKAPEKFSLVDLKSVAASGDVSYYKGHFYPNKAPGTSFLAVPAYWIIHHIERLFDANPDNWWTLTVNAWLTCLFSTGLLSAFGIVLFHRLALGLSSGVALTSLLATIAFAFGTMFFPYATVLYEHNMIAACLLASFYLLRRAQTAERSANIALFVSGLCAGYAAITNYIVVVVVVLLALYAMLAVRQKNGWLWFGLGVLGPFLLICAYNTACFDTAFTTNYRHQNPYFQSDSNAFLEVFVRPKLTVLVALLFSPFRGLFFSSPVLLMAVAGLGLLFRKDDFRAESYLIAAIIAFFLLFNISFEEWHGGWGVVPRYLGPAVPFLALGLIPAFTRFVKTTCLLGGISVAIMLLVTAVDPQPPIGLSDTASVNAKPLWKYDPITDYELPIFLRDRPWPLIHEMEQQALDYYEQRLARTSLTETDRRIELDRFHDHVTTLINAGEPAPLVLQPNAQDLESAEAIKMSDVTTIRGPVSVNVGGIYGGGMLGRTEFQWNSFNAGEFLFPQSRLSLLPLLVAEVALGYFAIRIAQRLARSLA